MLNMKYIDFHADDFALTPNVSKRIIELVDEGKLDSLSIIPNMSCYEECMKMLRDSWDDFGEKPLLAIHLNVSNGRSLINGDILSNSWISLVFCSFVPHFGRRRFKNELKEEMKFQIMKVLPMLPKDSELRLDSHNHTHMIPIVFDAMMEAVAELGFGKKLKYVRLCEEPFSLGFKSGIFGTYPVVNLIKNVVLNIFSKRAEGILNHAGISYNRIVGLFLSGKVDGRINPYLGEIERRAQREGHAYEIVRHPGRMLETEKNPECGTEDDLKFFVSKNRDLEYDSLADYQD